jgi:hypothetical protein
MVLPKEQVESTSLELLKAEQSVNLAELQSAVAELHKAVSTQASEGKSYSTTQSPNKCDAGELQHWRFRSSGHGSKKQIAETVCDLARTVPSSAL